MSESRRQRVNDDIEFEPLEERPIKGVTRYDWGAAPVEGYPTPMQLPVQYVTVQYTGSKPCTTKESCCRAVKKLQRQHLLRGYRDIKYSFLIGADGHVYEGRGWNVLPEVNKKYKKLHGISINVALLWRHPDHISSKMPDLNTIHVVLRNSVREQYRAPNPPPDMFHTLMDLLANGVKNKYIVEDYSFFNTE